jgi:hypothetical protein
VAIVQSPSTVIVLFPEVSIPVPVILPSTVRSIVPVTRVLLTVRLFFTIVAAVKLLEAVVISRSQ